MRHLVYDEKANIRLLKQLPSPFRVVFALLCALRILPRYRYFHLATGRGDLAVLEAIAERLWKDVGGDQMSHDEVEAAADRCLSLVPSEQDGWDEATQPFAEDASAAVAYALRARLTGDAQEAAWAGRRVYESIDRFVLSTKGLSPDDRVDELAVLTHPLVQAELARQQRDLKDLASFASSGSTDAVLSKVSQLRHRSQREAASFFGVGAGREK